jgi:cobalt-zinc-cadmium efflux system protein
VSARHALGTLPDSGRVLPEAAPADASAIRHLAAREHVIEVQHLHLGTVASSLLALPSDVLIDDACFQDGQAPGRFDVEHSTFHVELATHLEHEDDAHA